MTIMAFRDVVIGTSITMVVAQTIGVFLRALEDKFSVGRSLRIVAQIWALYLIYLFIPVILLFQVWCRPKQWSIEEKMAIRTQIELTVLIVLLSYILVLWKCAKRATAVYSLNQPHAVDKRKTLVNIAEEPLRNQLVSMATV